MPETIFVHEKAYIKDSMAKATPVARRWAAYRMKNGEKFLDFEDEFYSVITVEAHLYAQMKETLCHHITLHGLNHKARVFFEEFKALELYNRNAYVKVLGKVQRAFSKDKDRYLEYLISKINEFIHKVNELGEIAFQMLCEGKQPDLEIWSDKAALQDALFEENKQFLKQSLNHLQTLEKSKCRLGTAEIRMLLYHKQGCRREKLYLQVERWIINIYNSLPDDAEKTQIYKEICAFVADLLPNLGYISPSLIAFIFDRGFLSETSRDLLLKIKPIIDKQGMRALFYKPLTDMLKIARRNSLRAKLTQSDLYVIEIAMQYTPKLVPQDLAGAVGNA